MRSTCIRHTLLALLCLLSRLAFPQRLPPVPKEVNFGGETIYLDAQAQQRLQQELINLYVDRAVLRNATEQMQAIESLLKPMLDERSIPADMRYACLPTSTSNGAYWGLDARKASRLNLRVDTSVDERLNVASSSQAVLDELVSWHVKYKNWNWIRILLNYAAGHRPNDPANVVEPGGARLPTDQLQLPADSPPLIWLTLARKIAFEREVPLFNPKATSFLLYAYRQGQGKSLAAIAQKLGIEQVRFMLFNDWLHVGLIPTDKVYPVLIRLTPDELLTVRNLSSSTIQLGSSAQSADPVDLGFPVLRKLADDSSIDPITRTLVLFYEINDRKGIQAQTCDNIITLAYYGQLSVRCFKKINDMAERELVRPGEIYYLEPKARKAKIPFHVMQAGQTLREVSTIYGLRMKNLLRYNRLPTSQRLQAGRILWLREKRPANIPPEYKLLPEPAPPSSEPTLAERKLARENEEPAVGSRAPLSQRLPAVDSTPPLTGNRPARVAEPPSGNEPRQQASLLPTVAPQPLYYTVRPGDTHSGVAQRYNLSLADLMTWNKLSYRQPLIVGQQLIVSRPAAAKPTEVPVTEKTTVLPQAPSPARLTKAPADSTMASERPVATAALVRPQPERVINKTQTTAPKVAERVYYHVVQPGQTVYRVALINKVSVPDVMRWNKLTNYTIDVGQRILIRK